MKFYFRVFLTTFLISLITGFIFLPESYGQSGTSLIADASAQSFSAIINPQTCCMEDGEILPGLINGQGL